MASTSGSISAAGALMIISGILTVVCALVIFLALIMFGVGLIWLFPLYLGIREVIVGAQLAGGRYKEGAEGGAIMGIIGCVLTCNGLGLILEIIALVLIMQGKPSEDEFMVVERRVHAPPRASAVRPDPTQGTSEAASISFTSDKLPPLAHPEPPSPAPAPPSPSPEAPPPGAAPPPPLGPHQQAVNPRKDDDPSTS